MEVLLTNPDFIAAVGSLLGLAVGWYARHKRIAMPVPPVPGTDLVPEPTPPPSPLPNLPVPVPKLPGGLDPLEMLRLALELMRQRREARRKLIREEETLVAFEKLLPEE